MVAGLFCSAIEFSILLYSDLYSLLCFLFPNYGWSILLGEFSELNHAIFKFAPQEEKYKILIILSLQSLEKIFDHFTSQWVDMKSRGKIKEDNESQYFKFRPRSIRIEDILEGDLSPLSDSDGNMAFDSEEKLEQNFLGTVVCFI